MAGLVPAAVSSRSHDGCHASRQAAGIGAAAGTNVAP